MSKTPPPPDAGTWFLSHNSGDKPEARALGAALLAQGVGVWLDEWEIQAGERIVHKINVALTSGPGVIAIWSENALKSRWVERELGAAIQHSVTHSDFKVIPVVLDDTPLPALLAEVKWIDWRPGADRIRGLEELLRSVGAQDRATRRHVMAGIARLCDDLGVPMHQFWGVMVCRQCGSEDLEGSTSTDDEHDRRYADITCRACGWSDGTEI